MYTRHISWCLILFDHINTYIYLSLHDNWHSPEYLLGSFWLPWTCMFRFWSVDWSGALYRRSSLFLGASWFVLVFLFLDLSAGSRLSFSAREHLFVVQIVILTFVSGCDILYMYQYITLCDNFVILMLECIFPRASVLFYLPVLMLSVYTWGYFRPAYVRHSNVSVPAGSGRYRLVSEPRLSHLQYNQIVNLWDLNLQLGYMSFGYTFQLQYTKLSITSWYSFPWFLKSIYLLLSLLFPDIFYQHRYG